MMLIMDDGEFFRGGVKNCEI